MVSCYGDMEDLSAGESLPVNVEDNWFSSGRLKLGLDQYILAPG